MIDSPFTEEIGRIMAKAFEQAISGKQVIFPMLWHELCQAAELKPTVITFRSDDYRGGRADGGPGWDDDDENIL